MTKVICQWNFYSLLLMGWTTQGMPCSISSTGSCCLTSSDTNAYTEPCWAIRWIAQQDGGWSSTGWGVPQPGNKAGCNGCSSQELLSKMVTEEPECEEDVHTMFVWENPSVPLWLVSPVLGSLTKIFEGSSIAKSSKCHAISKTSLLAIQENF